MDGQAVISLAVLARHATDAAPEVDSVGVLIDAIDAPPAKQ